MRGATRGLLYPSPFATSISIHAPHAGCDTSVIVMRSQIHNFNPRTPCGVRLSPLCSERKIAVFQSTHPMRGATASKIMPLGEISISIHAPHAGCDNWVTSVSELLKDFNPRTPCGVRRIPTGEKVQRIKISIHAPHAGCDFVLTKCQIIS